MILAFTVLFISITASAKIPEYVPQFKIVSDTIDESIPKGKCLVTGIVTYYGQTVNEANIICYNSVKKYNSDKLGRYRMFVDTSTTYITASKKSMGTAYVEGVKFNSQHHMVIEIYIPDPNDMIIVEKPVIYLYNDGENLNVNLNVETDNKMLFTYPQKKENGWELKIGVNGLSIDNRDYPYLFWEAQTSGNLYKIEPDKIEGDLIKSDTVISYLEHSLALMNLNSTEIADFITYWGPRISQHEYAFVQFQLDDEVDHIGVLQVSPSPEFIRRVYMVFTGFNEDPKLEIESPIYSFKNGTRQGYYIVEWGGSEVLSTEFLKGL